MPCFRLLPLTLMVLGLACRGATAADGTGAEGELDLTRFYDLTAEASPPLMKVGEQGMVVLTFKAKKGAYLEHQAPWAISAAGTNLRLEKNALSWKDGRIPSPEGKHFLHQRFEIPLVATAVGTGKVDAKVKLFVCIEEGYKTPLCALGKRTLTIPVEVR